MSPTQTFNTQDQQKSNNMTTKTPLREALAKFKGPFLYLGGNSIKDEENNIVILLCSSSDRTKWTYEDHCSLGTAIADILNRASQEKPRDVYTSDGKFIVKNGHNFSQAWTSQSAKIIADELNRLVGGGK
jgi:hypothetical protein